MDQIIRRLNEHGIRYLVIGGQAVRLHGLKRSTMDWDFFIPPKDEINLSALNEVLAGDLGEEVEPLGTQGEGFVQTFQTDEGIIQFHLVVPGLPSFDSAEARVEILPDDDGSPVRCLSAQDLLIAKQATARPQDELDIRFLLRKARQP